MERDKTLPESSHRRDGWLGTDKRAICSEQQSMLCFTFSLSVSSVHIISLWALKIQSARTGQIQSVFFICLSWYLCHGLAVSSLYLNLCKHAKLQQRAKETSKLYLRNQGMEGRERRNGVKMRNGPETDDIGWEGLKREPEVADSRMNFTVNKKKQISFVLVLCSWILIKESYSIFFIIIIMQDKIVVLEFQNSLHRLFCIFNFTAIL